MEIQDNHRDNINNNCTNNFYNYSNKCINFCKSINNHEFLRPACAASDPASRDPEGAPGPGLARLASRAAR